jgi:spore photoproduct lyase
MFERIYIHSDLEGHRMLETPLSQLNGKPVVYVDEKSGIPEHHRNARTLFIDAPRSSIVGRCPGTHGHICCNYLTIDLYAGCLLGCTYCIMKSYLNFVPITVNCAIEKTIEDVAAIAKKNPEKAIRIGTGEVGDSLHLDRLFGFSELLIKGFARYSNVFFELKTKTDSIDHLLDIPEKGNTVIGFSINPERISESEDGYAASPDARIKAAELAVENGYRVSFHFDPIFHYKGFESDYINLIEKLSTFTDKKVAWISLGTFRYPKTLKEKIDSRWFLYDEFIPCGDKKYRYMQHIRAEIYGKMRAHLSKVLPRAPIYMCMESAYVWNKVFGASPHELTTLHDIFASVSLL